MSFNCSLNQCWCTVLSRAVRQFQLNCVCATESNPEPENQLFLDLRKQRQPQIQPDRDTAWSFRCLHCIYFIVNIHTQTSLSIYGGGGGAGLLANHHWSGSEVREDIKHTAGHTRTLPSKLLFQLGGSEPWEAISAWQGRQNQRQSGERTQTAQNTQEPQQNRSHPDRSKEQRWPHTGNCNRFSGALIL